MFEIEHKEKKIPIPHVFKETNRKDFRQIHEELRAIQNKPQTSDETKFMRWFLYLPAFLRRIFYGIVMRFPQTFRDKSSPVMITAVGMFGSGGGWAITMPNFTLNVGVGDISKRPGIHDGQIAIWEFLDLTVSIDHDIVDGAPATRFVKSFRSRLENAADFIGTYR